ncbi:MAG: ferrous iron transporter B [Melioribacteraceae bacterium]|nr:ferrous iron transporter B [Melioribacteraceae bacterium]
MKSDEIKVELKQINLETDLENKTKKIVLVGNPNVGKSCIFNFLSGMYVDVSNFPGTTVSITKGKYKNYELYDTPGIYGVGSFNDEEKVARDIILDGDIIINVVNALNLERDLFLTLQLIEMGKKVGVILNFADEIKKRKIKIDVKKLSELLGVEIIETAAIDKQGFDKIDFLINNAKVGIQNEEVLSLLKKISIQNIPQAEALLIAEGDANISSKFNLNINSSTEREKIYINRRNRVNEFVSEVEYEDSTKGEIFNLIGRISLNPITGIPLLIVMLTLVYFFIGKFVSQEIVDFTENKIGKEFFEYHTKSFVSKYSNTEILTQVIDENENIVDEKLFIFPNGADADPKLQNEFKSLSSKKNAVSEFTFYNPYIKLFFGEFGVITMTITYLLFLLFPLVIGFYLVMAFLEDSGYLPRLATMLDRAFNKIGLNGRAVIPIMLGFGCITMANITTRLLGTEREKSIVTAILQFVIPCSAQLAVIAVLLSGVGVKPMLIFISVIGSVLIILSTVLNKLLPGESSPLLIDLPMMRFPRFNNIIKKTFYRSWGFMKEAGFWFFIGALAVGILDLTGLLKLWQDFLNPLTVNWLKLPKEASTAFVMGMVRRDFGAAGLFELKLSAMQITVAIITITLFVPCIASFVVMLKERGLKEGLIIWLGTWVTAFFIGGLVAQIII